MGKLGEALSRYLDRKTVDSRIEILNALQRVTDQSDRVVPPWQRRDEATVAELIAAGRKKPSGVPIITGGSLYAASGVLVDSGALKRRFAIMDDGTSVILFRMSDEQRR